MQHSNTAGCILLKFYIKPQHTANVYNLLYVVSYRNSTSNHNRIRLRFSERIVVSYRNSTSNHNKNNGATAIKMLYLIEILHQTTTLISVSSFSTSCILSKFYIKPQLPVALLRYVVVVSYRNSTSNHNSGTTTPNSALVVSYRNSTSNHNQNTRSIGRSIVVSYRNSTSNHNRGRTLCGICELYLIEILHQTTTNRPHVKRFRRLYLIEILHQTTTPSSLTYSARPLYLIEILHQTTTTVAFSVATACCILSKFYIKPQPSRRRLPTCGVVSYRNSTSNHNSRAAR